MRPSLGPRLALAGLGAIAFLLCAELVARIQGDRVCVEAPGALLQADPRFGWTYVPGFAGWVRRCARPGIPAVAVDVNPAGRIDFDRPVAKPPGVARLLLLGGDAPSVLGTGNPLGLRPTTLARLLEARADQRHGARLEVIDATTTGYALDNDLLYLTNEGLGYAPDAIVVVVDPANDVAALSPALLSAAGRPVPDKPYLTLDGERLARPSAEVQRTEPAPSDGRWLSHLQLYRLARGMTVSRGPSVRQLEPPLALAGAALDAERERARRLATAILREMRDEAQRSGARLVLAVGPPGDAPEAREDARRLLDAARDLGIPAVDLAPPFGGFALLAGRSPTFPGGREWNPVGHLVASDVLWRFLAENRLLPASVVPSPVVGAGQVRDPLTFPTAIVDAFKRDRHTVLASLLQYGTLAACVVWMAALLPPVGRGWVLVAVNAALLAALSTPKVALVLLAFGLVFFAALEIPQRGAAIAAAVVLLLAFFVGSVSSLRGLVPPDDLDTREFLGLATNIALLRFIAYARERLTRAQPSPSSALVTVPGLSLRDYLSAMFFFPTFIDGPIQSADEFVASRPAGGLAPASFAELGAHLRRSGGAVLRACVAMTLAYASYVLLNDHLRLDIFATGGTAVSRVRLWLWVGELYFLFYFAFAAWTTAAISLGRLTGTDVPENFDYPWLATDVADFWRRWHISFGAWLRRFVYAPLGGRQRHASLNIVAVFVVSALWHVWGALKLVGPQDYRPAAWSGFLLWGLMNAAGVIVAHRRRRARAATMSVAGRLARRLATFVYVSLAWVPFFLPPTNGLRDCLAVFARLFFLS
jgi:D-alanyl-lipoteichoic acid acyltransferase DltB (MBOAT superfamily)